MAVSVFFNGLLDRALIRRFTKLVSVGFVSLFLWGEARQQANGETRSAGFSAMLYRFSATEIESPSGSTYWAIRVPKTIFGS